MATELDGDLIAKTPVVSAGRLYKTMMDLCSIGNRWPGTPGNQRAREYIQEQMKPLADKVELEDYPYPHYTPVFSSFTIQKPVQTSLPCVPIEYSQHGVAEGELMYVGEGWGKDFEVLVDVGSTFKDKIVIARTTRPYRVCPEAAKLGARGAIIISDSSFNTIRQITSQMGFEKDEDLEKFGASIPCVIIDRDSGEYVLSLVSSHAVDVSIEHQSTVEMRKSHNIIGYIYGSEKPKEQVIIGAHYDTQLEIEGAWDNASGCSALLEIMRVCASTKPKRTIVFCAFGGEEIGLFGSTTYVQRREGDLQNIICYINLDSTSADVCSTHELLVTPNMMDFTLQIIQENTNWKITQYREFTPLDHEQDSAEFVKCGVDAIWTHEEGNPYFHTKYDTLETINPAKLARATRVALLPFFYLANAQMYRIFRETS